MSILAIALLAQTAAVVPPPAAAPAAKPEKMVCRRIESTGSRVQGRRVCMSAKDWRGAGDQARSIKQGMQDMTSGAPAGL